MNPFKLISIVFGVFILIFLVAYVIYQRKLRREYDAKLNEHVNEALSKYYVTEGKETEYKGADINQLKMEKDL